jgi:glycerol-3-phosphate acyltransferase PlsY
LGISGWLGLATLSTWLIVAFFMRYSSLAALISAMFAPLYFIFLFGVQPMSGAIAIMGGLLIWRHKGNIKKLLDGTEGRIGSSK